MNNNNLSQKANLTGWLWELSRQMSFKSVFCPFSGNSATARLFKEEGMEVVTTDVLLSNFNTARALVENDNTILDAFDEEAIISSNGNTVQYFEGIVGAYKLPPEFGAWLDICYANIAQLDDDYKKALASTAISRVIKYMLAFDENSRMRMTDDDWTNSFKYYVSWANGSVFSNGKTCLAHDMDANLLINQIETEALSFYLPSAEGVADLRPAERFTEIFNRHCFEKELDETLSGLVSGLGAPLPDATAYKAALEEFLDSAKFMQVWLIAGNENSPVSLDEMKAMIAKFKGNSKALSKNISYSNGFTRTEYLFIAVS